MVRGLLTSCSCFNSSSKALFSALIFTSKLATDCLGCSVKSNWWYMFLQNLFTNHSIKDSDNTQAYDTSDTWKDVLTWSWNGWCLAPGRAGSWGSSDQTEDSDICCVHQEDVPTMSASSPSIYTNRIKVLNCTNGVWNQICNPFFYCHTNKYYVDDTSSENVKNPNDKSLGRKRYVQIDAYQTVQGIAKKKKIENSRKTQIFILFAFKTHLWFFNKYKKLQITIYIYLPGIQL